MVTSRSLTALTVVSGPGSEGGVSLSRGFTGPRIPEQTSDLGETFIRRSGVGRKPNRGVVSEPPDQLGIEDRPGRGLSSADVVLAA